MEPHLRRVGHSHVDPGAHEECLSRLFAPSYPGVTLPSACFRFLSARLPYSAPLSHPPLTPAPFRALVQSLLCDPNPNSPANSEAARMYSESRREYNKRVEEIVAASWTTT